MKSANFLKNFNLIFAERAKKLKKKMDARRLKSLVKYNWAKPG